MTVKLHESGEDYLEAMLVMQLKNGYIRSLDVAEYLNVKKPSVSRATKLLTEGGFITMDEDKHIHFTDLGRETAERVYERHRILTQALIALGVEAEAAELDACRIEHDISEDTFEKLKRHLEHFLQNQK